MAKFIEIVQGHVGSGRKGGFVDTDEIVNIYLYRHKNARSVSVKTSDAIQISTRSGECAFLYDFGYESIFCGMSDSKIMDIERKICADILRLIFNADDESIIYAADVAGVVATAANKSIERR